MQGGSAMHNKQTGGIPVAPGTYTVAMSKVLNGMEMPLVAPQTFDLKLLGNLSLPATDPIALENFKKEAAEVYGVTVGLTKYVDQMTKNVKALRTALLNSPDATTEDFMRADEYVTDLKRIKRQLSGDEIIRNLNESQEPNLNWRISAVTYGAYHSSDATQTLKNNIKIVKEEVSKIISEVKVILLQLNLLQQRANIVGSPWSPGRIPDFK